MSDEKEYKLVFAPGCFDNFEGTQEDLDELIQTLQDMIADGSLFDQAEPVDFNDETLPPDLLEKMESFADLEEAEKRRASKLN